MFKENLVKIRKNKGLSQEALAIKLNVVRQTISKWEKGLSVPDAEMLQKLADVLEVSASELLGEHIDNEPDINVVAETLAQLNEHLAIRNRRTKMAWKISAIALFIITIASVSLAFSIKTMKEMNEPEKKTLLELIQEDKEINPDSAITEIRTTHFTGDECIAITRNGDHWANGVWYIYYDDKEIIQKINIEPDVGGNVMSCKLVELAEGEFVEFYSASHMGNGSTYLWNCGELYKFWGTVDNHWEGYISRKLVKKYNLPILDEKDCGYGYSFVYQGGKLSSKYYDVDGDGYEDAVFEGVKELVSDESKEPLKLFLVKDVYLYGDFEFIYSEDLSYEKELQ